MTAIHLVEFECGSMQDSACKKCRSRHTSSYSWYNFFTAEVYSILCITKWLVAFSTILLVGIVVWVENPRVDELLYGIPACTFNKLYRTVWFWHAWCHTVPQSNQSTKTIWILLSVTTNCLFSSLWEKDFLNCIVIHIEIVGYFDYSLYLWLICHTGMPYHQQIYHDGYASVPFGTLLDNSFLYRNLNKQDVDNLWKDTHADWT